MRWMIVLFLPLSVPAFANGSERPRISSGFGVRDDPMHGRRAVHRGIDMPGRSGTPIVAAAGGIVRVAGWRGGYGQLVEIGHPDGTATRYAHLSRIVVRPGEAVAQGQWIADMGSTGRSTGSHLHFEYRVGGVAVDPRSALSGAASPSTAPLAKDLEVVTHRPRFARALTAAAPPTEANLPDGRAVAR